MVNLVVLTWCLFAVCAVNVKASSKYKECIVYTQDEEKSTYHQCRFCTKSYDDTNHYCREYSCAPTNCQQSEIVNGTDCCGSCPGTCNYGGRLYYVDDTFQCVDGSNTCRCIGTGVVVSTRKGYSKETLCEPRYYGGCTLYTHFENRNRNLKQECLTDTVNGHVMDICKEYRCGYTFGCENDQLVKNSYDDCYSCPNTCNYGGTQFYVNASFPCMDGSNTCSCMATGDIITTLVAQHKDFMCKQYGDNCVVYGPSDVPDSSKCRYCTRDYWTPWALYCKEYTCAETTCENPVKSGCCSSCPGTCNYGGQIYNVSESFTCIDGGNYCGCSGTGSIWTTLMGVSKETTCFNHS